MLSLAEAIDITAVHVSTFPYKVKYVTSCSK